MPITTLTVLGSIFALLGLALYRPKWGIIAYITLYIVYNPHAWWGGRLMRNIFWGSPSKIAMIFLVTGALIHFNRLDWNFSRREIRLYLFLINIWIVAYFFGVGVHQNAEYYLFKITKSFVFIFCLLRIIHSKEDFNHLIWSFIIGGLFLSYIAHSTGNVGRLDSIGGVDFREANAFASFIVFTSIAVAMKLLFSKSVYTSILYIFMIVSMLNAFIMTQSRAVFMGLFVAAIFLFFKCPPKYKKKLYVFMGLGTVLFFSLMDPKFLERMGTINDAASITYQQQSRVHMGHTPLSRIDFWKASILIFKDNPMGIGIKNFEEVIPLYDSRNKGLDAHNAYVLCYTEQGIFGIILFLVIIIEIFLQFKRINQKSVHLENYGNLMAHSISINLAIIALLFGTMITHSFLYVEYVWLLFSLPICLERCIDQELLLLHQNRIKRQVL